MTFMGSSINWGNPNRNGKKQLSNFSKIVGVKNKILPKPKPQIDWKKKI